MRMCKTLTVAIRVMDWYGYGCRRIGKYWYVATSPSESFDLGHKMVVDKDNPQILVDMQRGLIHFCIHDRGWHGESGERSVRPLTKEEFEKYGCEEYCYKDAPYYTGRWNNESVECYYYDSSES